jgi:hypothetical protein
MLVASLLLALTVAAGQPAAEVELVLRDGRVLAGRDVTRKDGQYLLEISETEVMSIPVEWVSQVRLHQTGEPDEEEADRPVTGHRKAEPETLAGSGPVEDAPTGMRTGEPETLAGGEGVTKPPTPRESLELLGDPAEFSRGWYDPEWHPKSAFTLEGDVTEFNPARWSSGSLDPEWRPEPALTRDTDVTDFNRAEWQESLIDPTWVPEDAHARLAEARETRFLGETASGVPITVAISSAESSRDRRAEVAFDRADLVTAGGAATAGDCEWCPDIAPDPRTAPRSAAAATRVPGRTLAEAAAAARAVDAKRRTWACATELFRPVIDAAGAGVIWRLKIEPRADEEGDAPLPLDVHRARLIVDGHEYAAALTLAGGGCRLLNGDADLLSWINVDAPSQPRYSERIYGEAVAEVGFVHPETDEEKLAYVVAVAKLLAPFDAEPPTIVTTRDALDRILDRALPDCPLDPKDRRRQARRARDAFAAPAVIDREVVDVVRFIRWTAEGGRLDAVTGYLSGDGAVGFEAEVLGTCVGELPTSPEAGSPGG